MIHQIEFMNHTLKEIKYNMLQSLFEKNYAYIYNYTIV